MVGLEAGLEIISAVSIYSGGRGVRMVLRVFMVVARNAFDGPCLAFVVNGQYTPVLSFPLISALHL